MKTITRTKSKGKARTITQYKRELEIFKQKEEREKKLKYGRAKEMQGFQSGFVHGEISVASEIFEHTEDLRIINKIVNAMDSYSIYGRYRNIIESIAFDPAKQIDLIQKALRTIDAGITDAFAIEHLTEWMNELRQGLSDRDSYLNEIRDL